MPPLDLNGSFALVTGSYRVRCGEGNHGSISFVASGQFCSHPEIENDLSAGVQAEPSFIGCLGGAMHPVAYHKLPRRRRFQGFRSARSATSWERLAHRQSRSGHSPV